MVRVHHKREREGKRRKEDEYGWYTSYMRMNIEFLNLLKSP
jgi:hypothetical protein